MSNNPTPLEVEQARRELAERIDRLFKEYKDADAKKRCGVADQLIEDYIAKAYDVPPCKLLDRLAGFILAADKNKKYKYKSEYTVLSKRQQKARHEREININSMPNAEKKKHNIQIIKQGKEKFYPDTF